MSLRLRINLMIGLTMLLVVGVGVVFVIINARHSVANEMSSTVNLARLLIDSGASGGKNTQQPTWLTQVAALERTRHLRVRIFAGRDSAPSTMPPARGAAVFDAPRWFVWAGAPEPIEIRKHIEDRGGVGREIRIRSEPSDEIAEAWGEARTFFLLIVLLALTIYALVHITLGRAFSPVSLILKGLEGLEGGHYGKRLPAFTSPEFARIAEAFNHAAGALEKAQRENRALKRRALEIQEDERRNLAREMHDELGQSLTAIKVMAVSLKQGSKNGPEAIRAIITTCDHLFTVVRSMMRRLHPISLEELGLKASFEDLLSNWQARNPDIDIEFFCDESVELCPEKTKTHLFRIAQECLTNIVKHARAGRIQISVRVVGGGNCQFGSTVSKNVILEIADDGLGFEPKSPRTGFGLLGMRERAESIGGTLSIDARPGKGVTVKMAAPLGAAL
ncbi:MAG: ATP-binding protein [Pseudomonadota bacterium]